MVPYTRSTSERQLLEGRLETCEHALADSERALAASAMALAHAVEKVTLPSTLNPEPETLKP